MSSQSGVIHLNIQGEIFVQTIVTQESNDRLGIHIILMLSGFHWFRLYEECAFKTLFTTVIASHRQHHGEVFLFALHVGIQQGHIAFATSPKDIVLTAQRDTCVNSVLDLCGRKSGNMEIRIRGSTVHVALMSEYVSR